MNVALVMLCADGSRRTFAITKPMTVIGRREECDFRVPLPSVSRRHCRLVKDGQYVRVEDLGSSNGTRVNGERVELAVLSAGDVLSVGPVKFEVQIDGASAAAGRDEALKRDEAAPAREPSDSMADDVMLDFDGEGRKR